MPSASCRTATRRSVRACRCRREAPSGSTAMTARASEARSWAGVWSGARDSTRCCTAVASSGGRNATASQIARTRGASIRPCSHCASVSGRSSSSWTDWAMRAIAVPRDWRSANPISSGAPRLIGEQVSLFSAWGSVSGRRRANSASSRACRAAAHATTLSRPITASTSSASSSPAGSAVPESSSRASQPDGRHWATEYGGAPSGSAEGSSGQPVDHGSPWITADSSTGGSNIRSILPHLPDKIASFGAVGPRRGLPVGGESWANGEQGLGRHGPSTPWRTGAGHEDCRVLMRCVRQAADRSCSLGGSSANAPAVDLVLDGAQVLGAVDVQVGALGEVLTQQAVGVLVRSALPGRMRVAEVDRNPAARR